MTREETSWYESVIISWLAQQYSIEKMGQAESFKKRYEQHYCDMMSIKSLINNTTGLSPLDPRIMIALMSRVKSYEEQDC